MADEMFYSVGDYSHEVAGLRLRTASLTAANFDAQATLRGTFHTAIQGVMAGQPRKRQIAVIDGDSVAWPSDAVAQRELKWLITYQGANAKVYTCEIPTADVSDNTLFASGSDEWDPTDAAWVAFISAFEALVVDEDDGAVTIVSARLVGRNT